MTASAPALGIIEPPPIRSIQIACIPPMNYGPVRSDMIRQVIELESNEDEKNRLRWFLKGGY